MLSIPRRQVRALLYRLAVDLQPVSRDHLCLLFWPDAAQLEAHRNLSHLLTHLRYALPDQKVLNDSNDSIFLVPELVWSDSATFQSLTSLSAKFATMEQLQQALHLYKGPLLDSFTLDHCCEFENWMTMQRSILEQRYLRVLAKFSDQSMLHGDYTLAIDSIQQALQLDPFDETLHRRLMQLFLNTGNRPAAVREYDTYANNLHRDLDLDPMPETTSLYQAALGN